MNTSKILFSTLVAAAAMTANATSLSDAVLAIDSFTADNITTLTSAGWTFSNITGTDDGTYTTTGTQGTISNSSVSLTSTSGSRNVWSAIVTVNASVFENSLSNMLVGNTRTDGGVSVAVKGSAIVGGYKNAYWGGNSITYNSLYADDNGNVTIGVSFDGDSGTTIYMGGLYVNMNGLKDGVTLDAIGLSTASGVVFSNLYWFNTAMSASDMQTAITAVSGMDYNFTYTWAGTESANTWNTTDENWTIKGSATAYAGGGDAVFDSTGYKTVAINGDISARNVTISDSYTFDLVADASLTATDVSVAKNCTVTLNLAGDATLSSSVSGEGIVKKLGAGTLSFTGTLASGSTLEVTEGSATVNSAQTFGSTIKVSAGTLSFSGGGNESMNANLDIGGGDKVAVVNAGWTDQVGINNSGESYIKIGKNGEFAMSNKRWGIVSNKKIILENGGKISGVNSADTYGNLDFNGANTISASGLENEISAYIRLRTGALTFDVAADGNLTFSGLFNQNEKTTKANGIIKSGAGDLILSGDNSGVDYGTIAVNGGVLVVENVNALGSGTLSVSDGATVVIGVEAVNASAVVLAEGAKFAIDLTDWGVTEGEALQLVLSTSINLGGNADPLSVVEDYFDADKSTLLDFEEYEREWGYDTTAGALTLTFVAIPEPSIFGLLAGMGALALVGTRRRRRA